MLKGEEEWKEASLHAVSVRCSHWLRWLLTFCLAARVACKGFIQSSYFTKWPGVFSGVIEMMDRVTVCFPVCWTKIRCVFTALSKQLSHRNKGITMKC